MNKIFNESIHGVNTPDYQDNHPDFGWKTNPNFRRQKDQDKIQDYLEKTDWKQESLYHNSVRVNGKNNIGRTIKMNNKLWHKLNS